MKNLFLYAKYLTHKQGKKNIGISDLRKAVIKLSYIILKKDKLAEVLAKELDIVLLDVEPEELDRKEIEDSIKKAKDLDRIDFTASVTKIKNLLKEHGYSMKSELIKINPVENDSEMLDDDLNVIPTDDKTVSESSKEIIDPLSIAMKLQKDLSNKIYGQDIAVEAIVDSVKNKVVASTNMPAHTFLFLGPPATGKTYLAKTIAENFAGYEFLDFSMQSYPNEKDGMNMFGSDSRYGNASPGKLTQFVRDNPKTVILLDEFEKAHSLVQKKFLSIFSEGYLDDQNGWIKDDDMDSDAKYVPYNSEDSDHKARTDQIDRRVNFTNTIIIITSNLGSELYNNYDFIDCIKNDYDQAETMIIQTLQKETKKEDNDDVIAIAPEMLSRMSQGKIVLFNKLSFENLLKISTNVFKYKVSQLLNQYKHIKIEQNGNFEPFLQCLLLKFAPYMDVRRIQSKIYENLSDQITDCLVENEKTWKDLSTISLDVSPSVLKFLEKEVTTQIKDETLLKYLFRKNFTLNIEFDLKFSKNKISLIIANVSFVKVRKVEDMIGNGAISFTIPETSFEDVAGHENVKDRLKEIGDLLKNPERLIKFGAKIPKGMLLHGVPGTGKTMLAKAFANYADLPFIQTTANDLIDHGSGNLEKMKEIFTRAKDYSPSIIFIDEIDTFGSREQKGNKVVINELLTQINGFSEKIDESIFIIAATNHKKDIDSAILRPGRIELHVEIPTLDTKGREYFVNIMLEKPCEKNISVSKLVMYSAGMTGAQLEKISNESSLYVLRNNLDEITEDIIIEQINIEKYGNRVTGKSIEDMLGGTAYHEAGHAVISKVLNPDTKIEQITVTPREDTLGFVSYDMEGSKSNQSKKDLENKICIAYAGRIAQIKEYNDNGLDTGASSDLSHATKLAYLMVVNFGMDEKMGYINLDGLPQRVNQGGKQAEMENLFKDTIETRISAILKEQQVKTEELVEEHWDKIDTLAKELLKKEVILEDELNKLIKI